MATFALTSCVNDEFIGDNDATLAAEAAGDGSIGFGFNMPNATRALTGATAAEKLGYNFYVTGTKGTEDDAHPTPTLVFDNYLVHYDANTAGTTKSNTHNWEYVGIDQSSATPAERLPENYDRVKLSSTSGAQTIKYWDYATEQYDFLAFSTGTCEAVLNNSGAANQIGVTAMKYGTTLTSGATAYTFDIPSTTALKQAYISDIVEVPLANYGKVVQLQFKSLGAKIRLALYETVPGYSVKDVVFYTVDGTTDLTDALKNGTGKLISADANGIPNKGKVNVIFNHVGNTNDGEADYNKASATVAAPGVGPMTYDKYLTFGTLASPQLKGRERAEVTDDNIYLGRTLPNASFVGDPADAFYQTVFPVNAPSALTLRVNYTLVPIDGAAETITVKGARAVVPSTYTKWLPNYAYTYIFKISDNTNGWTGATDKDAGLFPITFDAVVAQVYEADAEQTTVTTVATPSITTYQQGHNTGNNGAYTVPDEYQNDGNKLYVKVMNNSGATPTPISGLSSSNSLFFKVTSDGTTTISEASVMDALQNRKAEYAYTAASPVGRNGITLTAQTQGAGQVINNAADAIVNGVDDEPISVTPGDVAEIDLTGLTGTFAYVYVVTPAAADEKIYHLAADAVDNTSAQKYYEVALSSIVAETSGDGKAKAGKVYFVKNVDAKGIYVSYTFKQTKVGDDVTGLYEGTILSTKATSFTDGNFYFDVYNHNEGAYAVKVIKVVAPAP